MMRGRNLLIAAAVLVALILLAIFIMKEPPPRQLTTTFPEIKKDVVTKVWIRNPATDKGKDKEGKEKEKQTEFKEIILEKEGEGDDARWFLTKPIRYEAYQSYVDTMLSRLEELKIDAVAAESKESYQDLEIDADSRVEIKVYKGKTELANFFIGGYRGGATMVRFPEDENVYRVRGSIRYMFAKAPRDWREKRILNIENDRVVRLEFSSENGNFAFSKVEGEWVNKSETEIPDYDAKKVNSFVSTIAHLRATDFEDSLKSEEMGLGETAGRITIYYEEKEDDIEEEKEPGEKPDEKEAEATEEKEAGSGKETQEPEEDLSGAHTDTILVGNKKDESNYHIILEGKKQIFLISKYTAERLRPVADKFSSPPKKEPPKMEEKPDVTAKPFDSGSLPPEVMKKLQAEIKKQKLLKQLSEKAKK